jgi:hypothetical protein
MKKVGALIAFFLLTNASGWAGISIEGCFEDVEEARRFLRISTLTFNTRFLLIETYDPDSRVQPSYYLDKSLCGKPAPSLDHDEPSVGDFCFHTNWTATLSFDTEDRITFWSVELGEMTYIRTYSSKCDQFPERAPRLPFGSVGSA